ncbi:MAG: NUDIX domain-containing protein [Mangrovibacterium sp.]
MNNLTQTFRYCPRCGSPEFSPSGDRSMKCADCQFEFYLNVASAVTAIILNDRNQVLLTRRAFNPEKGKLDLPGGFVEFHESATVALARELKEELNAEVLEVQYLDSFPNQYAYSGLTIHTLDATFLVKLKSHQFTAMDDVASFGYWNLEDIPLEELAFQSTRNTILKLKESIDF